VVVAGDVVVGGSVVVVVGRRVVVGRAVVVGARVVGGPVAGAVVGGWVLGGWVVGGAVVVENTVVAPSVGIVGAPTPAWSDTVVSDALVAQGPSPQAERVPPPPATWSPKIRPMAPAATMVAAHGCRPMW
jgi:hypothetical protein